MNNDTLKVYILNIFGYDLSKLFFFCRLAKPKIMNRTKGLQKQTSSEEIVPSGRESLLTDVCVVKGTNSLPRQTKLYKFNKSRSNLASLLILRVFFSRVDGGKS